ncbi:class I SAM-dependent methyltransferase [Microbispora triticiradicis]|uniref:class I SAM-dependent methyltransferase n=1 Tax=Microbispora triticiradicis TaxID=2200763 RepID=UPI001AD727B9|nr:methyltransferase domain-containing protein [Microbispora triticiradicis]MBO4274693.1 methyltransferase domain-containing protein [Microbispora triticiradicis]
MTLYDEIGTTYSAVRRPDPRVAARITAAIGDAATVVNVGAGAGSYEPPRTLLAVEPSAVMIAQRPPGAAPAVRARAEALPLADDVADAVMAILTVHHWSDLAAGIAEMRRVARRRVVILTWDQEVTRDYWFLAEYLPEGVALDEGRTPSIAELGRMLGGARVEAVPVPHDCADGFGAAYWRRPAAYLDPVAQSGMSVFGQLGPEIVRRALDRLAADLESGRWHERHRDLLGLQEYDAGYRLLVADL